MDVKHHLGAGAAAAAAADRRDATHKLCSLENNMWVCAYRFMFVDKRDVVHLAGRNINDYTSPQTW